MLSQLSDLANSEVYGGNAGFQGGAGSPVSAAVPTSIAAKASAPSADDRVLYQNKVANFMKQSLDVTAQTVLSGDRRTLRLSLTPEFNAAAVNSNQPAVNTTVIPGGKP